MAPLAGAIARWEVTGHTIIRLVQRLLLVPAAIRKGSPSGAVMADGHDTFGEMTDLALLGYRMTSTAITIEPEKITGMLKFIIDGMNPFLQLGPGVAGFTIGLLMAYRTFRPGCGIRE